MTVSSACESGVSRTCIRTNTAQSAATTKIRVDDAVPVDRYHAALVHLSGFESGTRQELARATRNTIVCMYRSQYHYVTR